MTTPRSHGNEAPRGDEGALNGLTRCRVADRALEEPEDVDQLNVEIGDLLGVDNHVLERRGLVPRAHDADVALTDLGREIVPSAPAGLAGPNPHAVAE